MSEAQAPADGGQGNAPASSSAALSAPPAAPSGAPPAPTSQQITPPPAPQQPTAQIPWLDGADETTLGYAANKGWQKPHDLLNSYQNLEKLLGADKANNAIVIPKGDADPKEWAAVYDRLGRPTGPDGYKVEVPQGGDPKLQSQVLAKMHELGLTKTQGEALTQWFNETSIGMLTAEQTSRAEAFAREDQEVKTLWGAAYTQNLAAAQAAARGLGLDNATIDKLSDGIGHKATMELLRTIGGKMGEPEFVAGDNTEKFGAAMTPGQAKATIQAKMADKEWVQKYRTGGMQSAEFLEMQRLQAWANPEG